MNFLYSMEDMPGTPICVEAFRSWLARREELNGLIADRRLLHYFLLGTCVYSPFAGHFRLNIMRFGEA